MATITAPGVGARRGLDAGPLRHLDVALLTLPLAISGLGLVMIYTSSRNRLAADGLSPLYYVERQAIAIVVGVVGMVLLLAIDYRRIRDLWAPVYLATLPLLAGVLVIGRNHKGAQSWFQLGPMQFQPSEIAKVTLVLAIAGYCHQHRGDLDAWRLGVAITLAAIPIGLVLMQNDLGTAMVILVCASATLLVAGIRLRHAAVLVLLGATAVGAVVVSGQLQAYRVDRLTSFLNQTAEGSVPASKQTSGQYNTTQAKEAIAGGGLTGTGLFKGLQTKNGYVPEQHTDFIFTAVGEELGFVGGATLLALFALLAWRLWRAALLSSDFFGSLLAIGVLAMLAIQVFENVGMSMGIMPITGIPLPFMSYGGSAIVGSFLAVGLVANVHMRRFS